MHRRITGGDLQDIDTKKMVMNVKKQNAPPLGYRGLVRLFNVELSGWCLQYLEAIFTGDESPVHLSEIFTYALSSRKSR